MFSQDCRATVVPHSSVAKILHCTLAKILQRQVRDTHMNVVRLLHNVRATVLQNILGEKIHMKFLSMYKTFATSSRLVRDMKFSRY